MTRTILDNGLQELNQKTVQLGSQVENALEKAMIVLESGDDELAQQVITADNTIDALRDEVEGQALRLLRLQQPLGIKDIRYLTIARLIAGRMERVGDGAAGIVRMVLSLPFSTQQPGQRFCNFIFQDEKNQISEAQIVSNLCEMGQDVRRLFRQMLQALEQRDVELARHIWQEDDVVDVRYHMVRHDLLTLLKGNCAIKAVETDPDILTRATYLLWIAHKLERASDHCIHICKRIVYLHQGEWNEADLPPSIE